MLKEFFYLQKSDRKAVLAILCVLVLAVTIVFVTGNGNSYQESSVSYRSVHKGKISPQYYMVDGKVAKLFPFDPNTADSTALLKLGLAPWQVRSIYKYRAHGGIYGKPSDFARLYGLSKKQYEMLEPYIRISDEYKPASEFYGNDYSYSKRYYGHDSLRRSQQNNSSYSYPHKLKEGEHIALNEADTSLLTKIPGIGSGYARAIVRYRDRLGGFSNPHQLADIEGVPDDAIRYVTVNPSAIHKMNINKLTLNQLRKHPYINFYQAREICDYRRLKGPLKSLDDLKLLRDFPPAEIARLAPYVTF